MNTATPWERNLGRICDGAAIAVLVVVTVIAALTFKDYGLGWDDYTHAEYGGLLLRLYSSGFTDQRAFHFVNLYAYGGGFDMLAAYAAQVLPFDLWETRRLCGSIVGIVGLAVVWRIGRRLGGPLAGLLALALLATCPLYYGHMFINPKDAPFAVAMAIALLGTVRLFEEYPKPTAATVAIAGIGFGIAIGTRILGGFAVAYAIIALACLVIADWRATGGEQARKHLGVFTLALLPAIALAYARMALAWPWSVVNPANPFRALLYFSNFFETPWKELYAGQQVLVPEMPRTYVPQLFALKAPEIFLLLAACGIAGALFTATRKAISPQHRAAVIAALLSATVPILLTVATRPAMYNGIRHFTFVTPALAVLGGWAGAVILEWLMEKSRAGAAVAATAIIAAFAVPIADMAALHPYQYTSFNHIAGGVRAADEKYMLDYWGLAFKQASSELHNKLTERMETPPSRRRWRIAVCGPQRPAQVELGPEFVVSWDPRGAEFAMTLGEFYCNDLDAPILVEIKRDGVVFARVYDIRGKHFTSVLTSGK